MGKQLISVVLFVTGKDVNKQIMTCVWEYGFEDVPEPVLERMTEAAYNWDVHVFHRPEADYNFWYPSSLDMEFASMLLLDFLQSLDPYKGAGTLNFPYLS